MNLVLGYDSLINLTIVKLPYVASTVDAEREGLQSRNADLVVILFRQIRHLHLLHSSTLGPTRCPSAFLTALDPHHIELQGEICLARRSSARASLRIDLDLVLALFCDGFCSRHLANVDRDALQGMRDAMPHDETCDGDEPRETWVKNAIEKLQTKLGGGGG